MSIESRQLGKYTLLEQLAHGGMGEVWKALDTHLQRHVAIKLLRSDLQHDPDYVARFEREAQLIAALHHPNIVQIHDFRVAPLPRSHMMQAYMVMDYVQGQTLADYIRNTARKGLYPSAEDIVYLFTAISLAIDYAHQQGMIHRDIKPANILLDQRLPAARAMGIPILTDFGIARLQGVSSGTVVGSLIGTPLYISPEQAQGQFGDKRSDLYSLGVILYEMTTGITPFRGDTPIAIVMQHLQEMPTHPTLINPHITPALATVILKSLAKSPDARFHSASAMTIAIAEALNVAPSKYLSGSRAEATSLSTYGVTPTLPAASTPYRTPTLSSPNGAASVNSSRFSGSYQPMVAVNNAVSTPSAIQASGERRTEGRMPERPAVRQKRSRKYLYTLLIALLILLPLSALGTLALLSSRPTNTVAGHLSFLKSGPAASGYDVVQVNLEGVPAPPPGRAYYGWIESGNGELERPHWELPVKQGTINAMHLTYPGYGNLLQPNTLFLITLERTDTAPVIASLDLNARLYYARIGQSTTTTIEIKPCPTQSDSQTCIG